MLSILKARAILSVPLQAVARVYSGGAASNAAEMNSNLLGPRLRHNGQHHLNALLHLAEHLLALHLLALDGMNRLLT